MHKDYLCANAQRKAIKAARALKCLAHKKSSAKCCLPQKKSARHARFLASLRKGAVFGGINQLCCQTWRIASAKVTFAYAQNIHQRCRFYSF
jgi:hypothetical protein